MFFSRHFRFLDLVLFYVAPYTYILSKHLLDAQSKIEIDIYLAVPASARKRICCDYLDGVDYLATRGAV